MHELIHDLALSIVMAWLLGVAAHLARQPLILAYLVAGFLLGPSGLKWVQSAAIDQHHRRARPDLHAVHDRAGDRSEEDHPRRQRDPGHVGGADFRLLRARRWRCFSLIGIPLGDRRFDALYLAAAVSLSSTVIIVKVLYDKFELDTLPGRITLGVLVVQDLFAILFLAIQPSLNDLQLDVALLSVVRVGALLAAALLISRYTLPHLFQLIAHLPELVLVGALAWCFAVSEFAEFLGLSRVMGALIAGVSLSTFPYAIDVTAKVTSLRDFFITLFFVALGMTIPLPTPSVLGLALILVAFTWASRFVTVFPPLYAMRQGLRASLLPAINLAQISEFSLVLIQIGVQSGHTTPGIAGAASTAFVVLAVLNTFVMMRSDAVDAAHDPCPQAARAARSRSRRAPRPSRKPRRTQAAHPDARLLPDRQLVPQPSWSGGTSALLRAGVRRRLQSERLSCAAGARREGPLQRHLQRRLAAPCRHRRRRDRHFQRAGFAA